MTESLGPFEQAVLLAVLWLGEGAFGRAIQVEVRTRLDRPVSPGAVQATLVRLERKGFLASSAAAASLRPGRPRRFYRVEPSGRRALNAARAASDLAWRGLIWPLSWPDPEPLAARGGATG